MYSTSPQNANCAQMCSKLVCILSSKYVQNLCLTQRNLQFVQKFGSGQSLCRQQFWPGRSLKLPKKLDVALQPHFFLKPHLANFTTMNRIGMHGTDLQIVRWKNVKCPGLHNYYWTVDDWPRNQRQWYSLHQVHCNLSPQITKNASRALHCRLCSLKVPKNWPPPQLAFS